MLVLPVGKPAPGMNQPQVQAQFIQVGIGLLETGQPVASAVGIGIIDRFLEVQ